MRKNFRMDLPLPRAAVPFDGQYFKPAAITIGEMAALQTGPPGLPPDQAPEALFSNSSGLSIGSYQYVWVTSMGGAMLQSVQYSISEGAISDQTWTPATGAYVTTTGIVYGPFAAPGDVADDWNWYWDQNPGTKTVTINVTYMDGSKWTLKSTFTTVAPTVNHIQVTPSPVVVGPYPGSPEDTWGLFSATATGEAGVSYTASVTMPAKPGTAGFVQLGSNQMTATGNTGGPPATGTFTQTDEFPLDFYALDVGTGATTPLYDGYTCSLAANATTIVGAGGAQLDPPVDAPGQPIPNPVPATGTITTSVSLQFSYETYLDYQPEGGIHVEIASVYWQVAGTATYIGPTDPLPSAATYQNPADWDVVDAPFMSIASYGTSILTWNTTMPAAVGTYTNVTYSPPPS